MDYVAFDEGLFLQIFYIADCGYQIRCVVIDGKRAL